MDITLQQLLHPILHTLIPLLPRYSEEGSNASRLIKPEAITTLINTFGAEQTQTITTTIELIENLFTSLALLDHEALQRGEWQFVSHPAQLCALSLLHTLTDPKQKLFPSSFWQTAGIGDAEKQKQKQVLAALEDRRYAQHLEHNAPPIRYVYVAWGIIKLDDKILLHQREASEHTNEYGLIGGRTNVSDLRQVLGEKAANKDLLIALQTPNSPSMLQALEHTLYRECAEEIALHYTDSHYTMEIWRDLKPWQQCMGAAPNYALTQYFLRIYSLQLSTVGYLTLQQTLKRKSSHIIECTLDEIAIGITSDGAKKLRIDAIYSDFAADRHMLRQELAKLPNSYTNRYTYNSEKDSLIFSLQHDILLGEAGKEKVFKVELNPEQKNLLSGMAAHGKGLSMQLNKNYSITLHQYGWIEINDAMLLSQLTALSKYLRQHGFPYLELVESRYIRLSLPPEFIFFDPSFFSYSLQQQDEYNWLWQLHRQSISTVLGDVIAASESVTLKRSLASLLKNIASNIVVDDEHLPKKIRSTLQNSYQNLGLKTFLITKDKKYAIACERRNEVFPHP